MALADVADGFGPLAVVCGALLAGAADSLEADWFVGENSARSGSFSLLPHPG